MDWNKRDEFLLHLYDQLWNSVTRVEQGLWQFIGIYAGIIGIHWAIGQQQPALAACLIVLASFWGINIAINAGKWFERNRMMVINIEKQFLSSDDLGMIIPTRYHKRSPRRFFTLLDRLHMLIFSAVIVLSVLVYWDKLQKTIWTLALSILLIAGIAGTLYHWYVAWREVKSFAGETKDVGRS